MNKKKRIVLVSYKNLWNKKTLLYLNNLILTIKED